ncbi:MAG: DUF1049 domain-containing protein [Rhizobiaceae bacterium]|nr:DUF1049 domain-containing protein [Rhizobiaceae bacterium]
MLNRLILVAIVLPIAIVLIAMAVANRSWVPFTLDPFNPGNPAMTIQLPMFVFLFAAAAIGVVIGSCATWMKQGHYRKLARQRGAEAESLRQAQKNALQTAPAGTPGLPKQLA